MSTLTFYYITELLDVWVRESLSQSLFLFKMRLPDCQPNNRSLYQIRTACNELRTWERRKRNLLVLRDRSLKHEANVVPAECQQLHPLLLLWFLEVRLSAEFSHSAPQAYSWEQQCKAKEGAIWLVSCCKNSWPSEIVYSYIFFNKWLWTLFFIYSSGNNCC